MLKTTDYLFVVQVIPIIFVRLHKLYTYNCALKITVFRGSIQRSYINTLLSLNRNLQGIGTSVRETSELKTKIELSSKARKKCRPVV